MVAIAGHSRLTFHEAKLYLGDHPFAGDLLERHPGPMAADGLYRWTVAQLDRLAAELRAGDARLIADVEALT